MRRPPTDLVSAWSRPRGPASGTWAYVGRDESRARAWQRALGPDCRRLLLADDLRGAFEKLRGPYIEWLDDAGRTHDGVAWWSSQIAEENTPFGSLFTDLCLHAVLVRRLSGPLPPVLVAAEEDSQLAALEACGLGRRRGAIGVLLRKFYRSARAAAAWALFLVRALRDISEARMTRRGRPRLPDLGGRPAILLHSCINAGYFADEGPRDAYYSSLPVWLRERGYAVVTLPWLYSPGRRKADAWRWLRKRAEPCIVPEDFYGFRDYLWAMGVVRSQGGLPASSPRLEGLFAEPLVAAARARQSANTSAAEFVLYYRLFQRLGAAGFRPKAFIDLWENSLVERPARIAAREHLPATLLVGYQHFLCPPPLWLQVSANIGPRSACPQPDLIVCNSPMTRDLLAAAGVPPSRLRVGPSLRHCRLERTAIRGAAPEGPVFVGLSLDPSAALELLEMLLRAFPERSNLTFKVKPHPMMPGVQFSAVLAASGLPPGAEVTREDTAAWLGRVSCAVAMASGVALDMALAGVPVAVVGRESFLDFDPMASLPGAPEPCRSSDALRREVLRLTSLPPEGRAAAVRWARAARERLLTPVDDEHLAAFLPSNEAQRCVN